MRLELTQRLVIDLREIEGDGEFPCPTCGELISPDDESAMAYDILEVRTSIDGDLQDIIIKCQKCGSIIQIIGFELLEESGCLYELPEAILSMKIT